MKTQVISFHCVLKNQLGHLISSSINRDIINQSPFNELPDLERELQNVNAGDKKKIFISAERAYGFYDPKIVAVFKRSELRNGATLKVGDYIKMQSKKDAKVCQFRVIKSTSHTVVVDGNHPLAGQDLIFEIDITEARDLKNTEFSDDSQKEIASQVLH